MMNKDKTIAIITARMKSGRLPEKVLLNLHDRPALRWVADRCSQAHIDGVIIATTADPSNDPIETAMGRDYLVYRYKGDEEDVLGRVLAVAQWIGADIIVDVSGDCPCVDPRHIDQFLEMLKDDYDCHIDLSGKRNQKYIKPDYVSNVVTRTWSDGFDIQCYKTEALAKVKELFDPLHHVGWNICQHPEVFKIWNVPAPSEMHWPELGLTLDQPEDYELLKIIFNYFGKNPSFTAEEVVAWLKGNPHLLEINENVRRKIPEEEG